MPGEPAQSQGEAALKPIPIFSLTHHASVEMTCRFMAKLLEFCRDPVELVIHDDGSLTPEDNDRLRAALGPIRIVSRQEADDRSASNLAARPRCRELIRRNVFVHKIFDPPALTDGPFILCDNDILFLRPFEGLDRRRHPGEDLVFMKDTANSYSYSRSPLAWYRQGVGPYRSRLVWALNCGLLYCGPGVLDLDFVEWFLGNPHFNQTHWQAEQTLWSVLAGRARSRYYDPAQVAFPSGQDRRPGMVAYHYVSPIRHLVRDPAAPYYDDLMAWAGRDAEGRVATIRTLPARSFRYATHLVDRIYRKLNPDAMKREVLAARRANAAQH